MALTKLQLGVSALVLAGATTVILLQHQTLARLRADNDQLRQQLVQPAPPADAPAATASANRLSPSEQAELLRLRGEITRLRQQTNELAKAAEAARRAGSGRTPSGPSSAEFDPEAEQALQISLAKLSDAKLHMMSFFLYATDHGDQFPTNLDLALPYFRDGTISGSLTGTNQFEQLYAGPLLTVTNPATGIVLRETRASYRNGKWVKAYGFVDGHAEIHSEPDGNFERWEQEHVVQLKNVDQPR